jgi:cell division protease FtsH
VAALGYTLQLPEEDQMLATRGELLDKIRGLLGGRAAEEVVFGEVSSGAENDLEKATDIARQMVTMLGMGESVGLAHVARAEGSPFLPGAGQMQRDSSEATAREIDLEVKKLLDEAYARARAILAEHRDELDRVANRLLEVESLDREAFEGLVAESPGTPAGAASP